MMKYITWGSLLLTFCIGYGQPTTMQSKDSATFRDHLGDLTLTRANVELIFEFDTLPGNAGFWTIYHHRDSVDKIMGAEGSATNYLDNAISKYSEQKVSFTLTGKNSKSTWRKMYRIIKKEFGREFAERISIKERILFYSKRHDTGNIVKYFTAFIGRYPLDTSAYEKVRFNNNVWRLYFLYSADPSALSLAIKKMRTGSSSQWVVVFGCLYLKHSYAKYRRIANA